MNRRALLVIGGAGVRPGGSGCIDRLDGTTDESGPNESDSNGDGFANEIEAQQAAYGSNAEQLEYSQEDVDDCWTREEGIPDGLCSYPDELTCIDGCRTMENKSVSVYGLVLPSAEEAASFDEGMLTARERELLEETDFGTESTLMLQQGQPKISTGFEITFVGELSAEAKLYLEFRAGMSGGEEPAYNSRFLRIERATLPETLLVGVRLDDEVDDRIYYAMYSTGSVTFSK